MTITKTQESRDIKIHISQKPSNVSKVTMLKQLFRVTSNLVLDVVLSMLLLFFNCCINLLTINLRLVL
jgi:hypothetical protein